MKNMLVLIKNLDNVYDY